MWQSYASYKFAVQSNATAFNSQKIHRKSTRNFKTVLVPLSHAWHAICPDVCQVVERRSKEGTGKPGKLVYLKKHECLEAPWYCWVVIVKRGLHQQRCTLYGAYCGYVGPRRPSALFRYLMHDTSPDRYITNTWKRRDLTQCICSLGKLTPFVRLV
jgi:hypothetical protein